MTPSPADKGRQEKAARQKAENGRFARVREAAARAARRVDQALDKNNERTVANVERFDLAIENAADEIVPGGGGPASQAVQYAFTAYPVTKTYVMNAVYKAVGAKPRSPAPAKPTNGKAAAPGSTQRSPDVATERRRHQLANEAARRQRLANQNHRSNQQER